MSAVPLQSRPPLDQSTINRILLIAPVLLFSVVAHEIAHGYAALKQGDTTALSLGRLSWNPVKHIDPMMTIVVPLLLAVTGAPIIGGAKPVPVNPRNYRNYRRGDIIVSLAGVVANFGLAIIFTIALFAIGALGRVLPVLADSLGILQAMLAFGVLINLGLIAFNLIPIPPLDGSHVMKHMLPPAWALRYQQIGFLGFVILIVLIQTSIFRIWMTPAFALAGWAIGSVEASGLLLPQMAQWFR